MSKENKGRGQIEMFDKQEQLEMKANDFFRVKEIKDPQLEANYPLMAHQQGAVLQVMEVKPDGSCFMQVVEAGKASLGVRPREIKLLPAEYCRARFLEKLDNYKKPADKD